MSKKHIIYYIIKLRTGCTNLSDTKWTDCKWSPMKACRQHWDAQKTPQQHLWDTSLKRSGRVKTGWHLRTQKVTILLTDTLAGQAPISVTLTLYQPNCPCKCQRCSPDAWTSNSYTLDILKYGIKRGYIRVSTQLSVASCANARTKWWWALSAHNILKVVFS